MNDAAAGPGTLWALIGHWSLDRAIHHKDGRIDRLKGTCVFTRSGPRLLQDESGWLETPEGRFQASRRYVWAASEGLLEVSFADMRPFHSIPLGERSPETVHLCPPDRYHVAYDFADWPNWQTIWTVEGPRKDYRMKSYFSPQEDIGLLARAHAGVHKSANN